MNYIDIIFYRLRYTITQQHRHYTRYGLADEVVDISTASKMYTLYLINVFVNSI